MNFKALKSDEKLIAAYTIAAFMAGISYKYVLLSHFKNAAIPLIFSTFIDLLILTLITNRRLITKKFIVLSFIVSIIIGYLTFIYI